MTNNFLSQDTEINIVNVLVPYMDCKNFIDVGAEKGIFSVVLLEHGMTGVLFEPMAKHNIVLKELVNKYKNSKLYNYAITNIDGKQNFNVATDEEGKILDYYHSLQKASSFGIFSHEASFEVECRSLKSLAESAEIPNEIGLLKIDTEGNDLNVLRGLGDLRPEIIICEYFTKGLYDGWVEGYPKLIISYMRSIGYQSFLATKRIDGLEFIGINMDYYNDEQWGNLFFFRADFYKKIDSVIEEFCLKNESHLIEKYKKANLELEQKEKVIQQLLIERQELKNKVLPKGWNWLSCLRRDK